MILRLPPVRPERPARAEVPRLAVYAAGLVPAAWAFFLGAAGGLGPEPIRALEQVLGVWALRFLLASLAVTPLRRLSGLSLLRYRRALGLLAFFYALLHFSVYAVLDQGLDGAALLADALRRPYITVGLLCLGVLVPLAVTSHNAMIRRMGGTAWARLHRLAYVAAAAAALHFLLAVKAWPFEPVAYAALTAALLGWRLVNALQRRVLDVREAQPAAVRRRRPGADGRAPREGFPRPL